MDLIEILFEYRQNRNISNLSDRASEIETALWAAGKKSRNLNEEVESLRKGMARLILVVESMMRVGVKKGAWGENDLAQMMTEVDVEDGVMDGAKTPANPPPRPGSTFCEGGHPVALNVAKCPICNRTVEPAIPMCGCGRLDCLYCG